MATTNASTIQDSDFISSFLDHLLRRILGLVKTKEAVQTCVLWRRWEHLWTSLPSLDFDSRDFTDVLKQQTELEGSNGDHRDTDYGNFSKFVNMLLLGHKPVNLDVFRLSWHSSSWVSSHFSEYSTDVRNWVDCAVQHNPRVLHLDFIEGYHPLPHCICTWASLHKLNLYSVDSTNRGY